MKFLNPVIPHHCGVVLQPVQQFPCPWVAADHPHHLQIKAFKKGKLQKESAHRQIKLPIHRRFKIMKDLPKPLRHQLRAKRPSLCHVACRYGNPQRKAGGKLHDFRQLGIRYFYPLFLKKRTCFLSVKQKRIGIQHLHQPCILKCHQIAGRCASGKQHKAFFGIIPNPFA